MPARAGVGSSGIDGGLLLGRSKTPGNLSVKNIYLVRHLILKEYADTFDIKPGWSFLTGKPADVETLRHALGYVDLDPERDKDLSYHIAMATYGNDTLERWGTISLNSSAANIAGRFQWLTQP